MYTPHIHMNSFTVAFIHALLYPSFLKPLSPHSPGSFTLPGSLYGFLVASVFIASHMRENIGSVFLYLSLVLFTMVTSCYSFSCKWKDFAFPNGGVESHCLYSHMLYSGTHLPMGEDDSTACLS